VPRRDPRERHQHNAEQQEADLTGDGAERQRLRVPHAQRTSNDTPQAERRCFTDPGDKPEP
jgi:hypothetical protein